jgi:N-acetylmuramoyl-L-alanine amidase
MSSSHTVKQGEHLSGIAQNYGFRNYEVIWNHPNNADLKKKRVNPNVLYPGDVLYIPDKVQKSHPVPTTAVHVFKVTVPTLKLSVIVRDRAGKPLPNTDCELEVEGEKYKLKTDANGLLEKPIPATAAAGTLRVPDLDLESPVQIGHLDPVDEKSGLAGRLQNLGYYRGDLEKVDDEELDSAVQEFQCDYGLTVDGVAGPKTQAKLKEIHGC